MNYGSAVPGQQLGLAVKDLDFGWLIIQYEKWHIKNAKGSFLSRSSRWTIPVMCVLLIAASKQQAVAETTTNTSALHCIMFMRNLSVIN